MSAEKAPAVDIGLIRQAMAYRAKCRVKLPGNDRRKRIPLALLGVHRMNRGGQYPQSETVRNLGVNILLRGFNESEANHERVCVEEVPSDFRVHDPLDKGMPYETYAQRNARSSGHGALNVCFPLADKQDICYGLLSHNHLLLVLLSIVHGAVWEVPESLQTLVKPGGQLDYSAVSEFDQGFHALCTHGLELEVLSWRIYTEEPQACSMISTALNSGNDLALKTTELTALAVLAGTVTLYEGADVAGKVVFESVREKVRAELDGYVDLPEFMDLFEFCCEMGGRAGPWIPQLLEFGAKWVNSKKRQRKLSAFQEVNKMPTECPRCKIAVLMRAYRKPTSHNWCPSPEPTWSKTTRRRNLTNRLIN